MKEKIQNKLASFRNILDGCTKTASQRQKEFADRLLTELVDDFNFYEKKISYYKEQLTGFNENEYQDILIKCVAILQSMGFVQISMDAIERDSIELILKNQKELKRQLTVRDIENINKLYKLYRMEFENEPEKLTDLNKVLENV